MFDKRNLSSLSSGARQDANKLARGYYRTDDKTTLGILHAIAAKDPEKPLFLLDPCCGEGIVAHDIAEHLGNTRTYGAEIDGERFLKASEKMDRVVHGDALYLTANQSWAGLMFFNPPYGTTQTKSAGKEVNIRLEELFWIRHASRLVTGGLLIAVLPDYLFFRESRKLAEQFANYLSDDTIVYRAKTAQFKQIVIIGHRRDRQRFPTPNLDLRNLLLNHDADLPSLPQEPLSSPFLAPAGHAPDIFHASSLTTEAVSVAISNDNSFDKELERMFLSETISGTRFRSVAAIREGHIPALLASGGLDRIVQAEQGAYMVRGTVNTVIEVTDGEATENSTKTISTRKHETRIMAWDLSTFDLIDITGNPAARKETA